MYIKNALVLNSGPLEDFEFNFRFHANGNPKPTVIVGKNGSGKSNFLAFVTDALIELAAKKFTDVAPQERGGGHKWHRVIGGTTIRIGSAYELAVLKFEEKKESFTYVSKGGELSKSDIQARLGNFPEMPDWGADGSYKTVIGPDAQIEKIFRCGCYVSFPTSRSEPPYWLGRSRETDEAIFNDKFQTLLRKPIYVSSSISDTKPWLVDVLLDQMIDPVVLYKQPQKKDEMLTKALANHTALFNINSLLKNILERPQARLIRGGRELGVKKLMVFDGEELLLPSLDAFSSGQAMLFGIFGTILRYADAGTVAKPAEEMEGVVLIDEIDAHLHANLQHDALPKLMQLFPRIQFIVSAHSPLFPLGMEKHFGEENYDLIQMPDGLPISAERFSEFESAYTYLAETKRFEDSINERILKTNKSLLIVEGTTDIKYIMVAAEHLGKIDLISGFELIDGDGFRGLDKIWKNLYHDKWVNVSQKVILLYDCDINPKDNEIGLAYQRTIPKLASIIGKGIENLFTTETIHKARKHKAAFIDHSSESINVVRGKEIITPEMWSVNKDEKRNLCDWLCEHGSANDFQRFSCVFEILEECLRRAPIGNFH